jgi:hypothetical protein
MDHSSNSPAEAPEERWEEPLARLPLRIAMMVQAVRASGALVWKLDRTFDGKTGKPTGFRIAVSKIDDAGAMRLVEAGFLRKRSGALVWADGLWSAIESFLVDT